MNKNKFIQDIKELFVFAASLWGAITLLSLLLPAANAVWGAIPVQPQLVALGTAVAVMAALFAFAYSFAEKTHIIEFELRRPFYRGEIVNPRRDVLHNAVSRFAWGMISLSSYIALNALHDVIQQNGQESAKWLIPVLEPVGLILYAAAFALVTGAFGAVAMIQHTRPSSHRSINLGIRDETSAYPAERSLTSSPDGVGDTKGQE